MLSCTFISCMMVLKYLPSSEGIACSSSIRSQKEWSGGADPAGWSGAAKWAAEGHSGETAGCTAECFGFRYQSSEDTSLLRHKVQRCPAVPERLVILFASLTAHN